MSSFSFSRRNRKTAAAVATLAAAALVLSGCAATDGGSAGGDLTLKIGTALPQTGSLAFLGPHEEAGVALAIKDINEANKGIQVEVGRLR